MALQVIAVGIPGPWGFNTAGLSQMGQQGTGVDYDPPSGGEGLLGYQSGIYKTAKQILNAQGARGEDSSYDPPAGGSGIQGYLSGIFKASLAAATEATLAAAATAILEAIDAVSNKLPASLGAKTASESVSTTPASDAVFPLPDAQIGDQGTGSSYDPPTGGSGMLGYLSGIFKAALSGATDATLAALSAKLPASLGAKTSAASLSVTQASDAYNKSTLYDTSGNPINMTGVASVIQTSAYPSGATALIAVGSGANAIATATLAAAAGKTTYIAGYIIESTGATGASIVTPTIATLTGGITITRLLSVVAGASTKNEVLSQTFNPPIPADAANSAITVSVPALGAGNTGSRVIAWGYQL